MNSAASSAGAPRRASAGAIEVEDPALDRGRDYFIGIARSQEHGEILRGGCHERILKIYDANSRTVLNVQILAVVVAMREHARETIESRGELRQLGRDGRKVGAGCDGGEADLAQIP